MTFLLLKHPLYICLQFHLPLRIILLLYGEYIVHLHRQCERGGDPFRFLFRVLVIPNGHECRTNNLFSLLSSIMTPPCEWKNTEWNEKSQAIKKHKLKYRNWWDVEAKLAGSPRRRVPSCHSDFKSVLVKTVLFKICLVCLMIHIRLQS